MVSRLEIGTLVFHSRDHHVKLREGSLKALIPTCKLEVCEADEAEDCPEEGLDCLEEVGEPAPDEAGSVLGLELGEVALLLLCTDSSTISAFRAGICLQDSDNSLCCNNQNVTADCS